MKLKKLLYITIAILLLPSPALSKPRIIHAEWEYQNNENVAGYRLYHGNSLACATADPAATEMDCTVDASDGESLFSLTSYFQNGTESPPSVPFSYIFSEQLKAVLTADILEGESPLTITFDAASSSGNIIGYEWIFGDGETGSGNTTSHTFLSAGNYTVTLKVNDDLGASHQDSVQVVITNPSTTNTPPTAVISSSTSVGNTPLEVQLDGSGSTDSDGTIILYEWDLGDGGTSTDQQVTYTYTTAGTFNATLSVTDDGGLTDSISTPVIVSQPPEETNIPPVAVISASTNHGFAPLAITFNANGSSDPDGSISNYAWNFGDGTTSTGISANHIYIQPASYTVVLDVTDNMGASTTTSYVVTVEPAVMESSLAIELGTISAGHNWSRVDLTQKFVDPIVTVGPLSYNDSDPSVIRVKNVDTTGFDIRIQEWDYLDGLHTEETVHYIVMEQGSYIFEDGARVEAGSFTGTSRFQPRSYSSPFKTEPVVLTTVSSTNGENAVSGQIRKLSNNGFEYKLNEQEANRKSKPADESVGYIAWEPGTGSIGQSLYEVVRTGKSVTDQWHPIDFQSEFTENPFFFAAMQSFNSRESATVRHQDLSPTNVLIKIEEEASRDNETDHPPEAVGYIAITPGTH